jgi:hypothetical protein
VYPVIEPVPPKVPLITNDCPIANPKLGEVQPNCPAVPVIVTPDNAALEVVDVARLNVVLDTYRV